MPTRIDKLQQRVHDWQKVTFPHSSVDSKLHHMMDEIEEVREKPYDLFEWADLLILLMGAAKLEGFTMEDLLVGCEAKLIINKRRTWGEPDERGVVNHEEK